MPLEYTIFKDRPAPFAACPNCYIAPFRPFMRGMVRNGWRDFTGRPCWCVICSTCKEIVGYEEVKKRSLREIVTHSFDLMYLRFR